MSIKKTIKARIKRWIDKDEAASLPAVAVFDGPSGVLTVEADKRSRSAVLNGMAGAVGGATYSEEGQAIGCARLDVTMGGKSLLALAGEREPLIEEFNVWVKRFKKMTNGGARTSGGGWLFKWTLLVGAFLLGMVWLGLRSQAITAQSKGVLPSAAAPIQQMGAAGTGTPALSDLLAQVQAQTLAGSRATPIPTALPDLPNIADDDKIRPIASVTPEQVGKIKTATLLKIKPKGKPFYIFSNPTCGSCQDLDKVIEGLDDSYQPIVIPVGFDAEGVRLGTAALCSPDPVAEWKKVMQERKSDTPLCLDGLKKIETNAKLFASLGFVATPTLVTPDGRGSIGSVSPEVLAAWVEAR